MRLLTAMALSLFFLVGCGSDDSKNESSESQAGTQTEAKPKKPKETIVIDVCEHDPENADLWRKSGINLFTDPMFESKEKMGNIPACDGITAQVLAKRTVEGVEYYWIRYEDQVGWQTKRLLVGQQ